MSLADCRYVVTRETSSVIPFLGREDVVDDQRPTRNPTEATRSSTCGSDRLGSQDVSIFRGRPRQLLSLAEGVSAAWQRGVAGLVNARSVPHRHPNKTPPEIAEKVLHLRRKYHLGPIRIVWYLERYHGIKISDAGVYRILKRNGLSRLPRGTRMCCRRFRETSNLGQSIGANQATRHFFNRALGEVREGQPGTPP